MLHDISDRPAAELRALAAWYRNYAELASNPTVWHGRLITADQLEREAVTLEGRRTISQ